MAGTVDSRRSNDRMSMPSGARRFGMKGPLIALGLACVLGLGACQSPGSLRPGVTAAEVETRIGAPDARVKLPDGGERWQYPSSPFGVTAYMVDFDADGHLRRVTQALTTAHLVVTLKPGMTKDEVRAALGRPAMETRYARLEQDVWNWRYFDIGEINPHRELNAFFSTVTGRLLYYTMTPDPAFDGSSGSGRS